MSSTGGRPPRRMLPSVTDVVNELARSVQADPAVLFKVSRQVVAEELGRVKQGFESASIEILAKRARRLLDPATMGDATGPAPAPSSLFIASEPPPPPRAPEPSRPPTPEPSRPPTAADPMAAKAAPPTPAAPTLSPDEPFVAASELDLGWEKDLPIQADDAPFRSAILPIPRSRMPAGIAPPDATPPEAPAAEAARSAPVPPPGASEFELQEEPEPPAPAAPAPPPATAAPPPPSAAVPTPAPKPEPVNFLRSPAPVVPSAPPPLSSDERQAFSPSDTRPAFEPTLSPDERQPIHPPEDAAERAPGRITTREWKALGDIGVATERLADRPVETASAAKPKPSAPEPAGPKRSGRGWVLALLAVLAVSAGVAYVLRDFLFSKPSAGPENPVAARPVQPKAEPPTAVPAVPTPTAAASKSGPAQKAVAKMDTRTETKTSAAPPPITPAPRPAGTASGWTKGSLIVSKEWTGKPTIWVIHFSSHKDRAGAEKEAARLAAALGKTGRAIEVYLGEKGIWYRVLIGDFPTQDEARAYRTELEMKNTPGLGFVYQLKGE